MLLTDTQTEMRVLLRSPGGTIFKMAAPMTSGRKNFLKFQIVWTVMFVISFILVQVNDFFIVWILLRLYSHSVVFTCTVTYFVYVVV